MVTNLKKILNLYHDLKIRLGLLCCIEAEGETAAFFQQNRKNGAKSSMRIKYLQRKEVALNIKHLKLM